MVLKAYPKNDWQPGFVVTLKGDTVRGEVDYRNFKSNARVCHFRKPGSQEVKRYYPIELIAYGIDHHSLFVAREIELKNGLQKVFLEFLVKGPISIYIYYGKDERYFVDNESEISELKNTTDIIDRDGIPYRREKKEYIGIMKIVFAEAGIEDKIAQARLKSKSLIDLARSYYEVICPSCLEYEKTISAPKFNLGVVLGVQNHTQTFSFYNGFPVVDTNEQPNLFWGIMFNLHDIPGLYKRFSLDAGLLIATHSLSGETKKQLNIPLFLNYRLGNGALYGEIQAGTNSIFVRNSHIFNSNHMTFSLGLRGVYSISEKNRIFLQLRGDNYPRIFRIGMGVFL